jgi:preprotein translocase subunit SecF
MAAPILIWLKVGPDTFVPAESANDKAEQIGGPEQIG